MGTTLLYIKIMYLEVPLRSVHEVEPLIKEGADIFYCGVLNKNKSNINGRKNSLLYQFSNFKELESAIKIIHYYGKKIFLTLNGLKGDFSESIQQAYSALEINIDGFIITKPKIIGEVRIVDSNIPIILSVYAGIYNSQCLYFYKKYKINGFCFDRNISTINMKTMIEQFPELDTVAFVSGTCQYSFLCNLHNMQTKIPLNMNSNEIIGEMICQGWKSKSNQDKVFVNKANCRNWCSLCGLYSLLEIGVKNLKIDGRSLDLDEKINQIRFQKMALNQIDIPEKEYYLFCENYFKQVFGYECNHINCFY